MNVISLQCTSFSLGIARPLVTVARRLSIADIQAAVAAFYEIPKAEMVSARRAIRVSRPRQVAMYLARELTPQSLPAIGRSFGGRDHTTVIHAIRTVERLIDADEDFRADVACLEQILRRRAA